MKKIDITEWKEFNLTTLFDLALSKGDIQAQKMSDGNIPLVSSGKFHNGICKYIAKGDGKAEMFSGNTITTDMFGKSYYQSNPFYAVSHGRVNILIPRFKLTQNIALYIISILDASFLEKYSFSGMCNQRELKNELIKLPVVSNGSPDWTYIEKFISTLKINLFHNLDTADNLSEKRNNKNIAQTWTSFQMNQIFTIEKGTRLTKADMKEGNINFIGASAANNGVTAKIGNTGHLHPANTITVNYNGSVGEAFYQTQPFWASDDVNVLYPKFTMNQCIALFLLPIIKRIGKRYAFIDKWKKEDMENDFIKLPATSDGSPDWKYMENYISTLMNKQKQNLKRLM